MRSLGILAAIIPIALAACGGGGGIVIVPPPPLDTLRTVQGQVTYLPTGPDLTNRDVHGRLLSSPFVVPTFPRGAPRVPVEILQPDRTVLATGVTGADGTFSISVNFGKRPATPVIVRAHAILNLPFGTVVRVFPDAAATEPYSVERAPGGDPAANIMRVDVNAPLDGAAGAFHIADVLYEGFLTAKSGIATTMPDLDVLWKPGNGSTSSFVLAPPRGRLTIAGGAAGDPASNQDVWDEPQIMRLMGLYLIGFFFNEVAPDGTPSDALLVPSSAWREGFLDFWSCAGRSDPVFWDTEGIGAQGRCVRYYNIESFFDPALGSLGPGDPNVYQDPTVAGIGSRFSVAETLWDIHDSATQGDADRLEYPLFLTLRFLRNAVPGFSYPYFLTLLNEYTREGDIDPVTIQVLLRSPENQAIEFPATLTNGSQWPPPFPHPTVPGAALSAPYDATLTDAVDAVAPGSNPEIGLFAQRYFLLPLATTSTVRVTLTTTGDLTLDLLDLNNSLIATGPSPLVVPSVQPRNYVIRIRSAGTPEAAAFSVRLQLLVP